MGTILLKGKLDDDVRQRMTNAHRKLDLNANHFNLFKLYAEQSMEELGITKSFAATALDRIELSRPAVLFHLTPNTSEDPICKDTRCILDRIGGAEVIELVVKDFLKNVTLDSLLGSSTFH